MHTYTPVRIPGVAARRPGAAIASSFTHLLVVVIGALDEHHGVALGREVVVGIGLGEHPHKVAGGRSRGGMGGGVVAVVVVPHASSLFRPRAGCWNLAHRLSSSWRAKCSGRIDGALDLCRYCSQGEIAAMPMEEGGWEGGMNHQIRDAQLADEQPLGGPSLKNRPWHQPSRDVEQVSLTWRSVQWASALNLGDVSVKGTDWARSPAPIRVSRVLAGTLPTPRRFVWVCAALFCLYKPLVSLHAGFPCSPVRLGCLGPPIS